MAFASQGMSLETRTMSVMLYHHVLFYFAEFWDRMDVQVYLKFWNYIQYKYECYTYTHAISTV